MVRNRDPFSTALEDLRRRLMSGAYGGGASIVIVDEAKRLALSTTPVREALAWLSGAGLVEHMSTGGYRASRIEAGVVRDSYVFRRDCLQLSVNAFGGPSAPASVFATPEDLFEWIVGRGGNAALSDAFHRVGFHLKRLAYAELQVLGDPGPALQAMYQGLVDDRLDVLSRLIDAYHQDRIAASAVIAFEAEQARPDDAET